MKRILLAIVIYLATGPAFAQNTTCATRPAGDSSNACASTAFVGTALVTVGAPIISAASGSPNTIVLTPTTAITALTNGMTFRFVAPYVPTSAGYQQVQITGVAGTRSITLGDTYTPAYINDIQFGAQTDITYNASRNVFVIATPNPSTGGYQGGFSVHGMFKLQAGSSTTMFLGSENGGAVLGWDSTTSTHRLARLNPGGQCPMNLFNNTALIDGVANQSAADKLYYVMLEPQIGTVDPASPPSNCMSLWSADSTTYQLTVSNPYGIYVLDNNGVVDQTRVFLGVVRPTAGSITNNINPAAAMNLAVFSDSIMTRWKFGYQTTVVSNATSSAVLTTQTTPSISAPSLGIDESPRFDAKATATCDTSGTTISFRIIFTGTAFNGAPQTNQSPTYTAGVPYANAPVHITASWESAPSTGYYTAQTQIAVSAGSCTFATDILGHIAQ